MPKQNKLPKWAEYETVLEGVEKMQPLVEMLRQELLSGQKAKREGKPKRVAYHTRRCVNMLFNLSYYFWSPMEEWAKTEEFEMRYKKTPLQKAITTAAKEYMGKKNGKKT